MCQSCKQQATFRTQRIVPASALPPVLAVNTAILTDDAGSIWRAKGQNFLTPEVKITCGRDGRETVDYELRVSARGSRKDTLIKEESVDGCGG